MKTTIFALLIAVSFNANARGHAALSGHYAGNSIGSHAHLAEKGPTAATTYIKTDAQLIARLQRQEAANPHTKAETVPQFQQNVYISNL